MAIRIFDKLKYACRRRLWSYEKQARHAGVMMGNNNFIGSRFWSSEAYLITIGNHCSLTEGCRIHTHGGTDAVGFRYPKFDCFGKVVIGDYVYLGCNSLIMPGVAIGDNVLVAAGSVVTKSIPSNVVVAGNPARIICTIDEYLERNMKYNMDSKGMNRADKKKLLQSISEEKFIRKVSLDK